MTVKRGRRRSIAQCLYSIVQQGVRKYSKKEGNATSSAVPSVCIPSVLSCTNTGAKSVQVTENIVAMPEI